MKRSTSALLRRTVFLLCMAVLLLHSGACASADGTLRKGGSAPLLVADYAGMLSADEADSLSRQAQTISDTYGCQPSVVFVRGLNGYSSIMTFTEDFFLQNGYGLGSALDGVMLLVDVQGREYWIATSGSGIDAFTDAGQIYIKDRFVPYLSGGDWAGAARQFLSDCDVFLKQARTGSPYDVGHLPRTWFNPLAAAGNALLGLLAGGLPLRRAKKEMENVRQKQDAEEYITGSRPLLSSREDRFIGSHMSRVPIPRDIGNHGGGGGGGSSVHTSSGHTFGGSGGKF